MKDLFGQVLMLSREERAEENYEALNVMEEIGTQEFNMDKKMKEVVDFMDLQTPSTSIRKLQ